MIAGCVENVCVCVVWRLTRCVCACVMVRPREDGRSCVQCIPDRAENNSLMAAVVQESGFNGVWRERERQREAEKNGVSGAMR